MNILVSNDDGIHRQGIRELAAALSRIDGAKIYVFAPDRERTAAGHGITMRDSLFLREWSKEDYPGAERAYACSGTPADCVKIGISLLRQQGIEIDLVCSGINHGSNLGTDVFYSGTVAAAMEGRLMGVPAIAFSLCSHDSTHFEVFADLVPQIVGKSLSKIPAGSILNVNVPDIPGEELKGVLVTDMGIRRYDDEYRLVQQVDKGHYYEYLSTEMYYEDAGLDSDIGGYQQGYITISALSVKRTDPKTAEEIRSWGITWE